MSKEVGNAIYTERVKRRMSQTELAKAIGKSQTVVSAYEHGTAEPSFTTMQAIADVFSVSLDVLAGREEVH